MICCCRWVAVLTNVTSTFVPLVGRLVDKSQEGMEQSVTRQKEEDKDQKSQHEDDSGEGQEQMLEGQRGKRQLSQFNMEINMAAAHESNTQPY